MKTIKVHISPDGSEAKVGVEGVPGESCKELTESLERAMFGDGATSVDFTEEFHQEPDLGVNNTL